MLPGSPVIVRGNRHSHSRDPSPFGHRSSPEAPSLRRRYPASPVLQASPPPCRPDLALAGCRLARATPPDRASRVASTLLFHACCRHYPGGTCRCMCRSLPDRCQPSPFLWRVGFRITRFEACSAFTGVAARRGSVAEKGRVGDWRGNGRRMGVAVPGSFRNAGASLPAMAPFPVAALRTGQADLPHPALQWDHASRTRNTLATAGSR